MPVTTSVPWYSGQNRAEGDNLGRGSPRLWSWLSHCQLAVPFYPSAALLGWWHWSQKAASNSKISYTCDTKSTVLWIHLCKIWSGYRCLLSLRVLPQLSDPHILPPHSDHSICGQWELDLRNTACIHLDWLTFVKLPQRSSGFTLQFTPMGLTSLSHNLAPSYGSSKQWWQ